MQPLVLSTEGVPERAQWEFWRELGRILKPLLFPYTIGSLVGAVVLACAAYPLALAFVTSRRRIHDIMTHHKQL